MVSINNLGAYASRINFKGIEKTVQKAVKNLPELPKSNLPHDIFSIPYEAREELKQNYMKQLFATYFNENGKLCPQIQEFLDNTVFEIEVGTGKNTTIVNKTIKEHIRDSIHDIGDFSGTIFHGTCNPKGADDIVENGFDLSRVSRTNLGPGFYFTEDQSIAREYGGIVIKSDVKPETKAKIARADDRFYENVKNYNVFRELKNLLGISNVYSNTAEIQQRFCEKLIDKYSRDYIVNELGVDILSGFGGNTAFDYCTCVLNPKILSNLQLV